MDGDLPKLNAGANGIVSVLGHQTLAEAERYNRDADLAQLATGAFAKLAGTQEERIAQTIAPDLGKAAQTKRETK